MQRIFFGRIGLAYLCLAVCGCGSDQGSSGPSGGLSSFVSPAPGGSSPEDVFSQAKEAMSRQDWAAWCACFSPQTQEAMAFMWVERGADWSNLVQLAAIGGPAEQQRAQERLQPIFDVFARHGLDQQTLDSVPDGSAPPEQRRQVIRDLAQRVTDRPAFMAEMMAATRETNQGGMPINWDTNAQVTNVQISGDTATGTSTQTHEGQRYDFPIRFRQVNGRWMIDLTEELGFGQ